MKWYVYPFWFIGELLKPNGKYSLMRTAASVAIFLPVIAGFGCAFLEIEIQPNVAALLEVSIVAGFGGKALQAFPELKNTLEEIKEKSNNIVNKAENDTKMVN